MGQRIVERQVRFPATRARYFRVTSSTVSLNVVKISSLITTHREASFETLTVDGAKTNTAHVYRFDLGGKLPVERVRLRLPEPNTVAPTQLSVRTSRRAPWRPLAHGIFYRLNRDRIESESTFVRAHANGEAQWLARIDPRSGGIGSHVPQLEVQWIPQQIAFVARGPQPYRLQIGDPRQRDARLAIATLIPGYAPGVELTLPEATLEAQTTRIDEVIKTVDAQSSKRLILWAVLIAAVGFLGWMALRLTRDLNNAAPDPTNDPQPPQ